METDDYSIMARALEWSLSEDTGTSSKAIAAYMSGKTADRRGFAYPSDGHDFGRCARLLERLPEWRERLPEMARHSEAWAALVDHWDELETLYRDDADKLYDRMRAVLSAARKADRNLIEMGDGVSIRVGPIS